MFKFTLRQLVYFIVTADHKSLTEASKHVHVAQPALASAISKLEAEFGVHLINRHHARGVTLTPAGRKLIAEARSLFRHAEQFEAYARALSGELSGELEVGSYAPLAPVYLPSFINAFTRINPSVSVRVLEADQATLVEKLRLGEIELALLYDIDVPNDIELFEIKAGTPHAILPKGHPLSKQKKVSIRDIATEPYILLDMSSAREYFLGLFSRYDLEPNIVYRASSIELLRGMVGWGAGVSMLVTRPPWDVTYDGNEVDIRPLAEVLPSSVVCIARLRGLHVTAAAKAFVEFCQTQGAAMTQSEVAP